MVHQTSVRNLYGVSVWKSIRSGWLEFSKFLRFDVDDGTRVKFWKHEWCKNCSLKVAFRELYSISRNKESLVSEVSSLMGSCIGTFSFVVFYRIGRKHRSIFFEMCFIPQMCRVLELTDFARNQH